MPTHKPMTFQSIEGRRQAEQVRLDRLKTSGERNRLGQFATPPELAVEFVRAVWKLRNERPGPVRFLDPAVGTGSFYSALRQVVPAEAVAEAVGVELDPAFAEAASLLWGSSGLKVIEGDFTLQRPEPRFNLIVATPPYVRLHHLSREEKGRLQALVGERLRIEMSPVGWALPTIFMNFDAT